VPSSGRVLGLTLGDLLLGPRPFLDPPLPSPCQWCSFWRPCIVLPSATCYAQETRYRQYERAINCRRLIGLLASCFLGAKENELWNAGG
jgi:hypothetical protein